MNENLKINSKYEVQATSRFLKEENRKGRKLIGYLATSLGLAAVAAIGTLAGYLVSRRKEEPVVGTTTIAEPQKETQTATQTITHTPLDRDEDGIYDDLELKYGTDPTKPNYLFSYALKKLSEKEALKFKNVENFDENSKALIDLYSTLPADKRNSKEVNDFLNQILLDYKIDELEKDLFDDKFVNHTFPSISELKWESTREKLDKIYDINVVFTAKDNKTPISYAELRFIPVEYYYMIKKYGMRPEDYPKVFPPEEERIYVLTPIDGRFDSLEERFSVDIKDIIGGREYEIVVLIKDLAGNEKIEKIKTPYIRQFENLGRKLYERGIIIGASYMSEYYPWQAGKIPDDYPLLGKYDSKDEIVQWKHVDWAGYAGVNVFFIDAGAWEKWKIEGEQGKIMEGLMNKGMRCSFMWYAWGNYFERGTAPGSPEWSIDLRNPKNIDNFVNQISNILNSHLIKHPNYFRVNGRPVVFIYDAAAFIYEGEAFKELGNRSSENALFLADTIPRRLVLPEELDWYFRLKDFSNYDWISSWVGSVDAYVAKTYSPEEFDHKYYIFTDKWSEWTRSMGKIYVSSVFPGFKYIWESKGIPRDIHRIEDQLRYSLEITKVVRIDTWNDFGENTFIEPSRKEGFDYLYKIHRLLREEFD